MGGEPPRPLLKGKGLARKIELVIAKDLSKIFTPSTLIAIGAHSDSHLKYCERIGIKPMEQMSLGNYIKLLDH